MLHPDIIFSVGLLGLYAADPQKEHGLAIDYRCRYLNYTSIGMQFKIDKKKGFELYTDADFEG